MITYPRSITKPTEPTDLIEVLDMARLDGRGAVKAVCRVRYGQFVIGGIKIILPTLASRPFVSLPSKRVGDDWEPIVSILSPTLQQTIFDAVLTAWRRLGGAQ